MRVGLLALLDTEGGEGELLLRHALVRSHGVDPRRLSTRGCSSQSRVERLDEAVLAILRFGVAILELDDLELFDKEFAALYRTQVGGFVRVIKRPDAEPWEGDWCTVEMLSTSGPIKITISVDSIR